MIMIVPGVMVVLKGTPAYEYENLTGGTIIIGLFGDYGTGCL